MQAVEIQERGGPLRVVDRQVPHPGPGQVRIHVEVSGVCHGELMAIEGHHPRARYPRIPGHEVVGVIDERGPGVTEWEEGQRVGVGWNAGPGEVTGLTVDGGYAEYMLAWTSALVPLDAGIKAAQLAPLMCAGVTSFSALKHSVAGPGDLVAIVGLGGLGHLAVQYARHFGFHTVAVSRGPDKRELAERLGAHAYIDTRQQEPAQELKAMGGARVILATAPNARLISELFEGLGANGQLVTVVGGGEPIIISPAQFLNGRRSIRGWTGGDAGDLRDTVEFSQLTGIRPMVEVFPLHDAEVAFQRMMDAEVRFRAVLQTPFGVSRAR
jgi:propanol-preferring alcohol dehydrogenase